MATVDVIIPAYNAARYLREAIESVIAQEFQDWKIVLVNDGSTDDTDQVIAPYLQRLGEKMHYIQQANRGMSAARNAAIRSSTSQFLALLDADDVWLPCRLSESLRVLQSDRDIGLTYGGITLIDQLNRLGETYTGTIENAKEDVVSMIYTREIHLPAPTVTFRRECVEKVGLFDESMRGTEDRDLWFRIALQFGVGFIPKVLAYYRVSPNSTSTDPERMFHSQLQFIHKHYGSPSCGLLQRQRALARAYSQRAETYAKRNQRWTSFTSSWRAFAHYPFSMETVKMAARSIYNLIAR